MAWHIDKSGIRFLSDIVTFTLTYQALNKGNLKETWKLLNSIINKKKKTMQVGNEFENKSESITGDEHIANGFNNFFVNVGPSLADNIPATDTQLSQYLSASTNVKNSLFLNPVTEVDILQFVAKGKPKKSKGHYELDKCDAISVFFNFIIILKFCFSQYYCYFLLLLLKIIFLIL